MKKSNFSAVKTNPKIKKLIIALVLGVMISLLCLPIFLTRNKVLAADFSRDTIGTEYVLGERLSVPTATLSVGGQTYTAKCQVTLPSGRVYSGEKPILLDESGAIEIRYFTDAIDGVVYEEVINAFVKQNMFTVTGTGSVEYGTYVFDNRALSIQNGVESYEEEIPGAIVSLASGAKLQYGRAIDLTKLNKNQPLISFTITPEAKGQPDFRRLNVRVTDANNPDNYIIIRVKDKENDDPDASSYGMVGINHEVTTYRRTSLNTSVYGEGCRFSFRGLPGMRGENIVYPTQTTLFNDRISFYVDEEENIVYKTDQNSNMTVLCDLVGCGVGWEGFSTGLVNIEVFADMYVNSTANFIIRDVNNQPIGSDYMNDEEAPMVSVDFGNYDRNDLPNGAVNKAYKIFDATAYDMVCGVVDVKPFVYKNYYSNNRVLVNVSNGQFIPTSKGIYTIVYKATDASGNEVREPVDVVVNQSVTPIALSIDGNPTTVSALQGDIITLADYVVSGGHGYNTTDVSVSYDSKPIKLDVIPAETDGENSEYSFTALYSGAYTVTYMTTDFLNQSVTKSYTVQVGAKSGLAWVNPISEQLDKFYVSGLSYKLPEVKVYEFSNDGGCTEVGTTVSVESGSITAGIYTPADDATETFTFTTANGGTITHTVPVYKVLDDDGYVMKNLFVTQYGNVENGYDKETYGYSKYRIKENSSIGFINSVAAEGAAIKFNTLAGFNEIGKIRIKIVDKYNSNQAIELTFTSKQGLLYFAVNDVATSKVLPVSLIGDESSDVFFNLTPSNNSVNVNNVEFSLLKYLSGEDFAGFDSNLVYMTVEFENPGENGFDFVVKQVMNFTTVSDNNGSDFSAPIVIALGSLGGRRDYNSVYTLPKMVAYDVQSPYLKSFTVTVKDADGNVVTDVNGKSLNGVEVDEYQFKLSKFGKYSVVYAAKDYSNKTQTLNATLNVLDLEPPKITSTLKPMLEISLGDKHLLQTITVTDNISTEVTVEKYYKAPNGAVKQITEDSFEPTVQGTYVIYYYVYDSYDYENGSITQGNLTIASYTLVVK